ncbi:DNA polymerase III subunit delta [Paenibacillus sp. FSL H8-0548]|uniref:DNA polymerase III subunit delta n=1 Tax=Paenibacillus sp. FSL H8-0548 TaxID=1920422 RepID=UPI00096D6013|nr:DNA polymerase III subunit delta [Paenibacillus sp. FSL H8-0548]OMF22420.1 DNA polymerase III subunit delta [Paenibacillus sp. FSL H8-0548]
MDAKEAIKEIKGGRFRPIYVLYGKDRYRVQQFINVLTESMFTVDERELGIVKFDTAETSIEEAVLEAETLPFFVQRKLILIRDATLFCAGGKEGGKLEHRPEKLIQYMENPSESSIIVVSVNAEKLDERRKLVKTLKDRNSLIAFPELDAAQLKQWMIKRAAEQNRTMTADAAELLLSRAGAGMQQLSQEVDKLCLHAGKGGTIDIETASLLTAATVEEDVFALVDAIAELRIDKAIRLYRELLVRREEPIKIAALIARQLRIMLQIKELEQHQYSPQQMAGQLGLHPYAVKLASEKSRKFQVAKLGKLLASLADLDYQMKTGAIDKTLGLELYLLSLGMEKGA